MTDKRPVCANVQEHESQKAERMTCVINGFSVEYGHDELQNGDKWRCPECGSEAVEGFGDSHNRHEDAEFLEVNI